MIDIGLPPIISIAIIVFSFQYALLHSVLQKSGRQSNGLLYKFTIACAAGMLVVIPSPITVPFYLLLNEVFGDWALLLVMASVFTLVQMSVLRMFFEIPTLTLRGFPIVVVGLIGASSVMVGLIGISSFLDSNAYAKAMIEHYTLLQIILPLVAIATPLAVFLRHGKGWGWDKVIIRVSIVLSIVVVIQLG